MARRGDEQLRVLGTGAAAMPIIVQRILAAKRSIEIRAFLWRDDATGNRVAKALLDAADRGVRVTIHKDRIAAVYEYVGGNKQSFFHKRVDPVRGLQAWFLSAVTRSRGSFRQRRNPLAERLVDHPLVVVAHEKKRFDHSKLFVVDDAYVALGSMGIGDNHVETWVDIMVEVHGAEHVARLHERMLGHDEFDPSRHVDFLVHSRTAHRRGSCPMLRHRIALIDSAKRSLTVEMAYLGDKRFTDAMVRAVARGVEVHLVTAAKADVLGHTNQATCQQLQRRTGSPANLRITWLPRMVHSKVVVIDGQIADVGSANFTALSHGVYEEINLYANDRAFAAALEREIASHCREGAPANTGRVRKVAASVERAIVAFQARKGG